VLPNPRFEYSTLASMPRLAEEPHFVQPDAPAPRATAQARRAPATRAVVAPAPQEAALDDDKDPAPAGQPAAS
jgi:hypothetical protein